MKKYIFSGLLVLMLGNVRSMAQCSICTRTAQQMGEKPATALNRGIIYLAFTPLVIMGLLSYRWWKNAGKEDFHISSSGEKG